MRGRSLILILTFYILRLLWQACVSSIFPLNRSKITHKNVIISWENIIEICFPEFVQEIYFLETYITPSLTLNNLLLSTICVIKKFCNSHPTELNGHAGVWDIYFYEKSSPSPLFKIIFYFLEGGIL